MTTNVINDYIVLFDKIIRSFNLKATKYTFRDTPDYKAISKYYSDIESVSTNNCMYYDIAIPGSLINRLYVVELQNEDNDYMSNYSKCYKSGSFLVYVMFVNNSAIYKQSITREELAGLYKLIQEAFSDFLSKDEYIDPIQKIAITTFVAIEIVALNFDNAKQILISFNTDYRMRIPVEDEYKVFENFYRLMKNTVMNATEADVIRAYTDGVNNVETSTVLKTRFMPEV